VVADNDLASALLNRKLTAALCPLRSRSAFYSAVAQYDIIFFMSKVKCPNCGKQVTWNSESAFRPFCSDRCRLIDLGAWASEDYQIPSQPADPMQESLESDTPLH